MFKYPCTNCNDRVIGCHSTCQKYKSAKYAHKKVNAKIKYQKKQEEYFNDRKAEVFFDKLRKKL